MTQEQNTKLTKVDKSIALLQKLMQYRIILSNHNKIAKSSIPKKKQPTHNRLVADWLVKTRNAEAELDKLFKKLKPDEQQEFIDRSKAFKV